MSHGNYTPLQELPKYSDAPLHPQNTVELEASYQQRTVVAHNVTQRQVTTCCMVCSVLNFLCVCLPCLGIPALIFAILGTDAEKRRELEAAKSHAFHAKIFNIIYTIACPILTILYVLYQSIGIIAGIYFAVSPAANP